MQANAVKLTFSTTSGDLEDEFPLGQPLHAVKQTVLAKLKLDPSQANEFKVTHGGVDLDESKKLSDLGLEDCAVLVIERRQVVKI